MLALIIIKSNYVHEGPIGPQTLESGIIGQLFAEDRQEPGGQGELEAFDRLTLCLSKLRRGPEARAAAGQYFAAYSIVIRRGLKFPQTLRIAFFNTIGPTADVCLQPLFRT